MKHFNFKSESSAGGNIAKVVDSLKEHLDRNTSEEGFFKRYRLLVSLGGIATTGTVIAVILLRRDHMAEQAARNIAHDAFIQGNEAVPVEVTVVDEGEEDLLE